MKKIVIIIGMSLLFFGCARKPAPEKSMNEADSAEQHTVTGMLLLEQSDTKLATSQCKRALALEPNNSSAYGCLAIIQGNKDFLQQAKSSVKNDLELFRYNMAAIRVLDMQKAEESYAKIKTLKKLQLPYYKDSAAADYFLALRYFRENKFEHARKYSAKVFEIENAKFTVLSKDLWEKTDNVIRTFKLTDFTITAKKLVLKEKIKRVDVAVVLEDELHLARLMKGAFRLGSKTYARNVSEDILNHPNLPQIAVFYKYGLRGLEPKIIASKELFLPNAFITRAEFSLLLEDILSKAIGDTKMKTKYFGNKSLFVDVKNNDYDFNAINTAVARGFLQADRNAAFRPYEYLSGLELLKAIAVIKEEIR